MPSTRFGYEVDQNIPSVERLSIPQESKHIKVVKRDADGCYYWFGGDYSNKYSSQQNGSAVLKFDPWKKQWSTAYPYLGYPGDQQPIAMDEANATYDPLNDTFWFVCGFQNYPTAVLNPTTWPSLGGLSEPVSNRISKLFWNGTRWQFQSVADMLADDWNTFPDNSTERAAIRIQRGGWAHAVFDTVSRRVIIPYRDQLTSYEVDTNTFRRHRNMPVMTPQIMWGSEIDGTVTIDCDLRKIWICESVNARLWEIDITDPDNPVASFKGMLPPEWAAERLDLESVPGPIYKNTTYDGLFVYMKSRGVLWLSGPGWDIKPETMFIDINTFEQFAGPPLAYNKARTHKTPARHNFYHEETDTLFTGMALGNDDTWGRRGHSWYYHTFLPSIPSFVPPVGQVRSIDLDANGDPVNYIWDVRGTPYPDSGPKPGWWGGGGVDQLFVFNSGIYAEKYGPLGSLISHGGGDGAYWGNEVYRFDLETRRWTQDGAGSKELIGGCPYANAANCTISDWDRPIGDPLRIDPETCAYSDGQVMCNHTYDGMIYIPPELAGNQNGWLMKPVTMLGYTTRSTGWTHIYDFDTHKWRKWGANKNTLIPDSGHLPISGLDVYRKRVWNNHGYIDLETETHTPIVTINNVPEGTAEFDPVRDIFVSTGTIGGDSALPGRIKVLDVRNSNYTNWVTHDLVGAGPNGRQFYRSGFVYVPEVDCYYAYKNAVDLTEADPMALWKITPPSYNEAVTGQWTVERVPLSGGPIPPSGYNGTYGRFVWISKWRCFAWWARAKPQPGLTAKVWLMRAF